jgi:glycosyltransferase
MKISVATVCLNAEATIGYAIESFLKQKHAEKEMLLIDGASIDRTVEIAHSFHSPLVRIVSEKDRGIYDAMNKALRHFSGDVIGFLGADDALHDTSTLSRIAEALEDADIVYGDINMVRDHTHKQLVRAWKAGRFHSFSFARGWMPPHPSFYIRRAVVEAVGDFDIDYRIGGDYDYMMRAMMGRPWRIRYAPYVLVDFKLGGTSSSGLAGAWQQNLEALRARRRNLGSGFIDAAFFLKGARKIHQFFPFLIHH